jgi:hypothetical protein
MTNSFPFRISPSTSFVKLNAEEVGDTWVEFDLFHVGSVEQTPRVRVNFKRCISARMQGMGSEAPGGIGVLERSSWLSELNALQLRQYPEFPDSFARVRHFYFRGHDVTVEVLAEDCSWVFVRNPPPGFAQPMFDKEK